MHSVAEVPNAHPDGARRSVRRPVRLLLVDSNEDFLRAELHYFGADDRVEVVGQAGNAEAALASLEATRPDLVVLDMLLPAGGGLALAASLRRLLPNLTIILTALRDGAEYARAARAAGADGFVSKANFCAEMAILLDRLSGSADPPFAPRGATR